MTMDEVTLIIVKILAVLIVGFVTGYAIYWLRRIIIYEIKVIIYILKQSEDNG